MHKYRKLFLGILFDAIGYASYLFPGVGEFTDNRNDYCTTTLNVSAISSSPPAFAILPSLTPLASLIGS